MRHSQKQSVAPELIATTAPAPSPTLSTTYPNFRSYLLWITAKEPIVGTGGLEAFLQQEALTTHTHADQ